MGKHHKIVAFLRRPPQNRKKAIAFAHDFVKVPHRGENRLRHLPFLLSIALDLNSELPGSIAIAFVRLRPRSCIFLFAHLLFLASQISQTPSTASMYKRTPCLRLFLSLPRNPTADQHFPFNPFLVRRTGRTILVSLVAINQPSARRRPRRSTGILSFVSWLDSWFDRSYKSVVDSR